MCVLPPCRQLGTRIDGVRCVWERVQETDFDLSLDDVIIGGTKLGEGAYGVRLAGFFVLVVCLRKERQEEWLKRAKACNLTVVSSAGLD